MSARVVTFDVPSPLGALRCAATPAGLALVALPGSDFAVQLTDVAPDAPRARGSHPAAQQLRGEWNDTSPAPGRPLLVSMAGPGDRKRTPRVAGSGMPNEPVLDPLSGAAHSYLGNGGSLFGYDSVPADPDEFGGRVGDLLREGDERLLERRYLDAIPLFEEALAADPGNVELESCTRMLADPATNGLRIDGAGGSSPSASGASSVSESPNG